jgi:glycosyltransferase involved in cell wall biosynthesis
MSTTPLSPGPVSAYIPCYNNAETLAVTITGIREQTHPVDDLFVVDDGSSDKSAAVAENLGVRVVKMGSNQGRGAVRARAMEEARHDLVLCCDATNRLVPTFLADALKHFSEERVLGVYGRWFDRNPKGVIDRWRARHLFQQHLVHQINQRSKLATYGAIVRKSAALRIGNYNVSLRHGEDYELGERLLEIGDVVYNPFLEVAPAIHNSLVQVMERYSRWNRAALKVYTLSNFLDSQVVAWRILIPEDIAHRDWAAIPISAAVPYFCWAFADKTALRFSSNDLPETSIDRETTHGA